MKLQNYQYKIVNFSIFVAYLFCDISVLDRWRFVTYWPEMASDADYFGNKCIHTFLQMAKT